MKSLNPLNFRLPNRSGAKSSRSHGSATKRLTPELEIAHLLGQQLTFAEQCERMLGVLARAIGADLATLREPDLEHKSMILIAQYKAQDSPNVAFPLSVAARSFTSGTDPNPVIFDDYSKFQSPHPDYLIIGPRSGIIAPIIHDSAMIGLLAFGSSNLKNFGTAAANLLMEVSSTVGILMQNARLVEEREIEADIGRILSSSLDLADGFRRFADEAGKIIKFDRITLNTVNLQEGTYITEFLFGDEVSEYPVRRKTAYSGTLLEPMVLSRQSLLVDLNDSDDPASKDPMMIPFFNAGVRSFLGIPLIAGDQLVGTLGIMRRLPCFTSDDMGKAERLGNVVAGALANFESQKYRVQASRELQKNRAILQAEAIIGRIVSSPLAIADVFDRFAAEFTKLISFDRLTITAVDLNECIFTEDFRYSAGDRDYNLISGDPYHGTMSGAAVEAGKSVVVNAGDPELQTPKFEKLRQLLDAGQTTFMAIPLVFRDQIVGALAFSRAGEPYTEEERGLALRIGILISGPLAGHVLQKARERVEADYRESEARFRQIANSIKGVFWLTDLEPRRLIYASPNYEDLWDVPAEDVYEDFSRWIECVHSEDRPRIEQASSDAVETGEFNLEYRVIKRDGSIRWILSRGFPVRDEVGKIFRMSGIAEDITEQKIGAGKG